MVHIVKGPVAEGTQYSQVCATLSPVPWLQEYIVWQSQTLARAGILRGSGVKPIFCSAALQP